MAGVVFPGGLFYVVLSNWVDPSGYYSLITGILLIDAAVRNPEGFAGRIMQLGRWVSRRAAGSRSVAHRQTGDEPLSHVTVSEDSSKGSALSRI